MNKILIGLGNPDEQFLKNRHNVGFLFLDYVYRNSTRLTPFKYNKFADSFMCWVYINNDSLKKILLVKPQTFMNRSGVSVKQLFKLNIDVSIKNLIIVHDDLDILLGDFKISSGKGPKKHNGIISIEKSIETNEFLRVRIGIENRSSKNISGEKYVLQDFTETEFFKLEEVVFPKIFEKLINL